jgi:N-acetylglutamate synthase-like GNAT family acetyltransferase
MKIRRAEAADRPAVRGLAAELGLEYPEMDDDPFWIAEADGAVAAICGLKRHPDCLELCSVGVAPAFRGRGTAAALIGRILEDVPGDIYLTTVKPAGFRPFGFAPAPSVPASLAARPAGWCDGCRKSRCAVLVRRGR